MLIVHSVCYKYIVFHAHCSHKLIVSYAQYPLSVLHVQWHVGSLDLSYLHASINHIHRCSVDHDVTETPGFTNNPHCHSATRLYYWLIISKKKYSTNNEEQHKFHSNYSTTGSKTLPKHNEATTKTPSTTCTKSPIQNTIQQGYHTSNAQRYDRVQTRHSKRITDRKNTEEEDAEIATRKETQTVKNDPAVV